ncbi:hypothetical protein GOBAR_AA00088 [Gossypium barbadense]|uniref:Uncharacterized protein n=1 Tax=Gossypium barbadense TaxID=3634 RepID=A0A2P5YXZ6_GOSBA|nr:hypothetical protein GOBAR_AA00088 [Gossypium barbadense]
MKLPHELDERVVVAENRDQGVEKGRFRLGRDWLFSHVRVKVPHPCIVAHGLAAWACLMPVSKKQNRALSLAARGFPFPRPCSSIKFTHSHVAWPWGFIASRVLGKSFTLILHGRIARPCFSPCLAHDLTQSSVVLGTCVSNTLLVT